MADEIEQRKITAEALKESEERYRELFDNMGSGVAVYGAVDDGEDFEFIDFNKGAERIEGINREEIIGRRLAEVVPGIKETGILAALKRVWQTGNSKFLPESLYMAAQNESWREGYVYKLVSGEIVAVYDDVTERRRNQEHIRSLSRQLLKAQEAERQIISRELHDRVAQDLSTVKIGCDTLFDGRPQVPGDLRGKAGELSAALQKAIMAVRDLSYDLRPPALDQLGASEAIFQYCEDFSEKTGLKVRFNSAGMQGLRLDFDTEINLYRLVQEGLNNVAKHSGADSVTVKLVSAYPSIILRIEDDGKGFDVEKRLSAITDEKRMGLRSMQERVSLLGGKMRIDSRENQGTRVFVDVPHPDREALDGV
ncbi:MAG: PAS domain-containing protein [Deltaproteobacteria bacterium]|nr:PAS domain-containing protein [Deltaproteobacteria bacterium]